MKRVLEDDEQCDFESSKIQPASGMHTLQETYCGERP